MSRSSAARELQPLPSVVRQRKLTDAELVRLQNTARNFAAVIIFGLVGLAASIFLSIYLPASAAIAILNAQLP